MTIAEDTRPQDGLRRWLAPNVADTLMALGLAVLGWMQISAIPRLFSPGRRGPRIEAPQVAPFRQAVPAPSWQDYVLVGVAFLPLALRRRFPLSVLAVTTIASGIYDRVPGHPPAFTVLAPLIALYTVGTLRDRRTLWSAGAAATVFTLVLSLPDVETVRWWAEFVRITAMFAFAAALGDATRNRRAYVAEVEQRAAEAEHTRDEEARRRVEDERLRIARELHDVTAHSLSIIAVQAGAAQRVVERDPVAAGHALEAIRTTSKAALDELRAMLGVLRGGEDGVPLAPTGTLRRLDELVHGIDEAGVHVSVDVAPGALDDLPSFADVSAFRIVQEALTNVVRHAEATTATVAIARDGDELAVTVTDDGRGAPSATREGHGIAGMRERVIALGGTFEAGPAEARGFRVHARIPLKGGSA